MKGKQIFNFKAEAVMVGDVKRERLADVKNSDLSPITEEDEPQFCCSKNAENQKNKMNGENRPPSASSGANSSRNTRARTGKMSYFVY